MKMFLKIVKFQFISAIKKPVVLICLSLALTCSILVSISIQRAQSAASLYPIAIVDEDGGEYARLFVKQIKKNEQIDLKLLSREKVIKQVAIGRIDGAFILANGFSDKVANNDYHDIVEFISPSVTTSAYPVSEIVSSEIIDLWLAQLVENYLIKLHNSLGDRAVMSVNDILDKMIIQYKEDDIIKMELIGDSTVVNKIDLSPVDKAVGIYAAFVIFAIMLSGEWVFNIKNQSLQSRFISHNTSLTFVCLGSQIASVLVSMLFFIPYMVFVRFYFLFDFHVISYLTLGMLLYLICICSISFIISTFAENLSQLIVVGTSASIINILISSLIIPLPDWSIAAKSISKVLPGTYLLGCYNDPDQILKLFLVTICWLVIGYLSVLRLKRIK